ncbi:Retinoic acid induced 16-like protein-domain-containing protein [Aspergillus coremiiformis]|uniref:Retinoic acid induced 16-like protein-domain-containing protein n=1 Tax=Aspergillus coremiiformis TaxID=138285 RepID=A0A5N6ZG72_9EURO|nr:Retinoic acid induced 16-like protein-domain-containing protein [Aspergillus coremiiformis]
MDFWSRLIGGSRSLSTKNYRATSPTERLTAFKRTCNTLQQIWRSTNLPSGDQSATTHARNCIDRLNSVLSDESRGPAPHPCLAYAASSQIFVTVTKLALSSYDDGMLRSAAVFFNTLIDSEVDGVVDNRLFARALVDLVRRADKHSEDVEGRLVELLFGVANNIRLQPDILPAWFAPRSEDPDREQQVNSGAEFAGATRKDDFPLFYLLVEYVHHGGRAGDFARTGLLYLIETASRSKNLERWLIESDLATLMATGLGALYSQLGSLSFDEIPDDKMPHIVALSDHAKQETALPPALGASVDSFMSYLLFWQDTIDHCKSAEVNGTLLDHFQVLFLEQLLYPSLLESSDVEGGSTAAVLTYLYRILESIVQDDLVHRILHFLLASPSTALKVNMSISRRKSLDVLAAFSEEAAKPSPSLFNLRDLALLGLQSSNRQTVLATLRLMAVILQRHHTFARSLIWTVPGQYAKQRTVGALNAELEQLMNMATSIVDDPTLHDSFDNYLKDALWTLESHLYIPPAETTLEDDRPLEIRQEDPIVQELLNCLETFFTNSVIVNLALTEVLMSIASSHLISLDGWLLVDSSKYVYGDQPPTHEGSTEILGQIQSAYQEPLLSSSDTPTLTFALQKLVQKIQQWRKDVPDFDILVAARRDLLHQEDSATEPGRFQQPSEASPRVHSERQSRKLLLDYDIGPSLFQDPPGTLSSRQAAAVDSPLREPSIRSPSSRDSSPTRPTAAEELRKRLEQAFQVDHPHKAAAAGEKAEPTVEGAAEDEVKSGNVDEGPRSATLGHVLTNVVILYEFLLEVSATVQARSTLFGEAGYPGVGWNNLLDEQLSG